MYLNRNGITKRSRKVRGRLFRFAVSIKRKDQVRRKWKNEKTRSACVTKDRPVEKRKEMKKNGGWNKREKRKAFNLLQSYSYFCMSVQKRTEEGHGKEAPTDYLLIKFRRNIWWFHSNYNFPFFLLLFIIKSNEKLFPKKSKKFIFNAN